jgi:hypothetical protein
LTTLQRDGGNNSAAYGFNRQTFNTSFETLIAGLICHEVCCMRNRRAVNMNIMPYWLSGGMGFNYRSIHLIEANEAFHPSRINKLKTCACVSQFKLVTNWDAFNINFILTNLLFRLVSPESGRHVFWVYGNPPFSEEQQFLKVYVTDVGT